MFNSLKGDVIITAFMALDKLTFMVVVVVVVIVSFLILHLLLSQSSMLWFFFLFSQKNTTEIGHFILSITPSY